MATGCGCQLSTSLAFLTTCPTLFLSDIEADDTIFHESLRARKVLAGNYAYPLNDARQPRNDVSELDHCAWYRSLQYVEMHHPSAALKSCLRHLVGVTAEE
jgi:hypothetical protein